MNKTNFRCLIKNRFKAVDCPDRVEIFDQRNPTQNPRGKVIPLGILPVAAKQTAGNACRAALSWLHDSDYLSTGDYLVESEKLACQASVELDRYAEIPEKDCIE
jgi:hypothetical protein